MLHKEPTQPLEMIFQSSLKQSQPTFTAHRFTLKMQNDNKIFQKFYYY